MTTTQISWRELESLCKAGGVDLALRDYAANDSAENAGRVVRAVLDAAAGFRGAMGLEQPAAPAEADDAKLLAEARHIRTYLDGLVIPTRDEAGGPLSLVARINIMTGRCVQAKKDLAESRYRTAASLERKLNAAEEEIERLRAAPPPPSPVVREALPRWRSIAEEGPPAPEVFVLCWDGKQTFVEWFGSKPDAGRGVTHWIPYPMPPGAESDMHDGRRAARAAIPATPEQPANSAGETPTQHAHRWATELACSMARKFYPEVPQWRPLPDLLGVVSQIDNMTKCLVRAPAATPPSPPLPPTAAVVLNQWAENVQAGRCEPSPTKYEPQALEWDEAPLPPPQGGRIDPMQNPMRPAYFTDCADETPAEQVLRKLACWLGVGGYNAPTVDAEVFHEKIVWGINHLLGESRPSPAPVRPEAADVGASAAIPSAEDGA